MSDNTKTSTSSPKARRGKGEGTVWQLPSGEWAGQISLGSPGGKRKRLTIRGRTKGEVINQLAKRRSSQLDGQLPDPSILTVEKFMQHWLDTACARSVAGSTLDSYTRNVKLHINPSIGGIRLQKLTAADAETILATMTGSPRLKRYVMAILSRALKQAKRWRLVSHNVCEDIERPRVPKFEIHPLDKKQSVEFLKAVKGNDLEAFFVLAIGTGARESEILALRWSDADLKNKTLSIQRTLSTVAGELVAKEPKTLSSRRQIRLDDRSVAALQARRKASMAAGLAGHPWAFCDAAGGFMDRFAVLREFKRILKRAKLPEIRIHDLRHTHATLLFLDGANPKVVSERLGHSSIAITLDIYGHVLPSMQDDAVKKLNRLLG